MDNTAVGAADRATWETGKQPGGGRLREMAKWPNGHLPVGQTPKNKIK